MLPYETAVSLHIGTEDGREVAFNPLCVHIIPKTSEWKNRNNSLKISLSCNGLEASMKA
jgi:hypothetical protein